MAIGKGTLANFGFINWQFKQRPNTWALRAKWEFVVQLERVISGCFFTILLLVLENLFLKLGRKTQLVHSGYWRIYLATKTTAWVKQVQLKLKMLHYHCVPDTTSRVSWGLTLVPSHIQYHTQACSLVSYLWSSSSSFITLYLSASWFFLAVKILLLEITLIIWGRTNLTAVCFQFFPATNV